MAVSLQFLANSYVIDHSAGSGLGFYGPNFGRSITVGSWNERTFITSSDGTTQGAEADNCKWVSSTGVSLGSIGSGILLTQVPNDQATLQISLNSDTSVQVPTATAYFYDRSSINNAPSGITFRAAEIIHPDITQANNGSGDTTWLTPAGSSVTVSLAPSPGSGGLYAGNGSNSTISSLRHDWFMAISASPNSVGSKTSGIYVSIEYN